jgi:hypothetical protein
MLRMKISAALVAGIVMIGQSIAAPALGASPQQANASAPRQAPLPAGPAASVREAQGIARPLLYWAGAGALIITGVILIGQDDDGTSTTATTSTGN